MLLLHRCLLRLVITAPYVEVVSFVVVLYCHVGIWQNQYLCHLVLRLTLALAKAAWLQQAAAVTLRGNTVKSSLFLSRLDDVS